MWSRKQLRAKGGYVKDNKWKQITVKKKKKLLYVTAHRYALGVRGGRAYLGGDIMDILLS